MAGAAPVPGRQSSSHKDACSWAGGQRSGQGKETVSQSALLKEPRPWAGNGGGACEGLGVDPMGRGNNMVPWGGSRA